MGLFRLSPAVRRAGIGQPLQHALPLDPFVNRVAGVLPGLSGAGFAQPPLLQPGQHQHLAHSPAQNLRRQRVPIQRAMDHEARQIHAAFSSRPADPFPLRIGRHHGTLAAPAGILPHGRHPSERACVSCDTANFHREDGFIQSPRKILMIIRLVSLIGYVQSPSIASSGLYRCSRPASTPEPRVQLLSDTRSNTVLFEPAPSVLDRNTKPLYYNYDTGGTCNPTSASVHRESESKGENLKVSTENQNLKVNTFATCPIFRGHLTLPASSRDRRGDPAVSCRGRARPPLQARRCRRRENRRRRRCRSARSRSRCSARPCSPNRRR